MKQVPTGINAGNSGLECGVEPIAGYKDWAATNYPLAPGWNSATDLLLRRAWMDARAADPATPLLARIVHAYDNHAPGRCALDMAEVIAEARRSAAGVGGDAK